MALLIWLLTLVEQVEHGLRSAPTQYRLYGRPATDATIVQAQCTKVNSVHSKSQV